jgi:prevent-host-death family protein
MIISTISEAETKLSSLIERALEGEEVLISREGKTVAVLTAYHSTSQLRRPGRLKGKITIADDFDELPSDIAAAMGMNDE